MINFICNNWYLIVAALVVIFAAGYLVYMFIKLPTATQIASLKEWLKYAVTWAEKELGSGTGQLKLRMVYELFIEKFTWLAKWISFDTFSGYVDEALIWMKNQIDSNKSVAALVSGGSKSGE